MTSLSARPEPAQVLARLKDFQRSTVDYVFRRLYTDEDRTNRFLVADEVGLGKTLVARGLIALAIEHLQAAGIERVDIVYICSNADIARQNVARLNVTGHDEVSMATRLTLLATQLHGLRSRAINFVSFTPATSFDLGFKAGVVRERILLYHLLRRAWGFGNITGPKNLFQGMAGREGFRDRLGDFDMEEVDADTERAFCEALEETIAVERRQGREDLRTCFDRLCGVFARSRRYTRDESADRNKLIGRLRRLLARTCVRALQPDLIILDEFQRFKTLLDGTDDASMLAKELFEFSDDKSNARVLLLSATPYKMYTLTGETDEDHYRDFVQTLGFLHHDATRTEAVRAHLDGFRRELLRLGDDGSVKLAEHQRELERELRRVIARTERLAASSDRSGMLREVQTEGVTLTPRDAATYPALQRLARELAHPDVMEFWKAAPYLLAFMDDYKLKSALKSALQRPEHNQSITDLIAKEPHLRFPWASVAAMDAVDPPHARLRWLSEEVIDKGHWRLLWMPASLSYYRPSGPFAEPDVERSTKRLVFSAWRVVPRAIATVLSYEAERRMLLPFRRGDEPVEKVRERLDNPLRFAQTEGRLSGMPVLGLLYPSFALARLGDPLKIGARLQRGRSAPSLEEVHAAIAGEIATRLEPLLRDRPTGEIVDEAWYWAAPILLDLAEDREASSSWLSRADLPSSWIGESEEEHAARTRRAGESGSLWDEHVARARRVADDYLGTPPADLAEVLALLAIGAPAVTALRALSRANGGDRSLSDPSIRDAAGHVAAGFRNLFNLPEVAGLVRGIRDEEPYWRRVLEYCAQGGLQAVLDEYAHLLKESLGLFDREPREVAARVAQEIRSAMGVRTSALGVDEVRIADDGASAAIVPRRLRARFAMRFGEEKAEDGTDSMRADHVRTAFNSPFWPFVLATTAVGQEGLDFHHYCHAVVHWNLPANPVDMEQREGRVHRYKGHAVRKNVAMRYGRELDPASHEDPWEELFELASAWKDAAATDIVPYWIFPLRNGAVIQRHVPALPLSRDIERLAALRQSLAVYRMVFGQPRQDELLDYLLRNHSPERVEEMRAKLTIDLRPAGGSRE